MAYRSLPRFDPGADFVIARASAMFPKLPAGAPVPPEIIARPFKLRGLYHRRIIRPVENVTVSDPQLNFKTKKVKNG